MFILFYSSPWGGQEFPFTAGVMNAANCLVFLVFLGSQCKSHCRCWKRYFSLPGFSVIEPSEYFQRLSERLGLCICPAGDPQTDARVKATVVSLWGRPGDDTPRPSSPTRAWVWERTICASRVPPCWRGRTSRQDKSRQRCLWGSSDTRRLRVLRDPPHQGCKPNKSGTLAHVGLVWGCLCADTDYLCLRVYLCWGKDGLSVDNWVKSNTENIHLKRHFT